MNKIKLLFTFLSIVGAVSIASAQASSSAGSGPSGAPIDGGVGLLVGGMAAYGIKKIRDNHKKLKANKAI
jgi:hypothetical protein